MAKLYPPQINGTIPAFYSNIKKGTTDMVVPFSMNRAVSFAEINGFIIQIKTLNGSLIGTVPSESYNQNELIAIFNVRDYAYRFTLGSYYKVQLAYIEKDTNEIGYYSTVGVIKYTSYPTVKIDGLNLNKTNSHQQDYIGVYSQENGDATEKLYSSYFVIYDEDNVFYQSEEKLHNNTNDTERNLAIENLRFLKSLQLDKLYQIEFFVTTTNGIIAKSPRYRIAEKRLIDPSIHAKLKATLNYDNGYILLYLEDTEDTVISGSFLISRASNLNNYIWEPIRDFTLQSIRPNKWLFKDCTIEQGVIYKYSIQQFNSNSVYSSRIESDPIEVDFEDAFLFDGDRQLRIRFNPKISSFKTDLQENKTDTIGHQYPYFTRNSHIYYKEFPISGLISYLSDENELFIKKSELKINFNKWNSEGYQDAEGIPKLRKSDFYEITTNLTANNFISERTFKMTVLQWLNNGKPKLFRSPGEGNYLVRLMNVSLSPTDSLSRMLHTFSCTAYEIGECSLDVLNSYEIYDKSFTNDLSRHWGSINIEAYIDDFYQQLAYIKYPNNYSKSQWRALKENAKTSSSAANVLNELKKELRNDYNESSGEWINIINGQKLSEIFVVDMMPGSKIKIDGEEIIIGTTGSYRVINELDPFTSFEINLFDVPSGIITYSYEAQASNMFEIIESVNTSEVPCFQAIGKNISRQIVIYDEDGEASGEETTYNLLKILQDCKKSILNISQLKAIKRPIIDIILDEFSNDTLNDYSNIIFNLTNSNLSGFHFTLNGKVYNMSSASNEDLNPLFLYQIRAPRLVKNVRLEYFSHDTSTLPPPLVEISKFHIYKDNQPFTFEQYYIDKNMDLFCPYTGFLFDALTGKVIQATDDLFTFQLDDEIIDISDIETWKVRQLNPQNLTAIIPNDGVYLELSYSQSDSIYQFDSINDDNLLKKQNLFEYRKTYEKVLGFYLIYRNQGYNKETMDQIKDCAPTLYNELKTNSEDVYKRLNSIDITIYEDGVSTTVHQDMILYKINNIENPYAVDDSSVNSKEFDSEEYRTRLKYLEGIIKKTYEQYVNNLDQAIKQYRKDNEMI